MRILSAILLTLVVSACSHPTTPIPDIKPRVVSTDERTRKTHMELSYKDLSTLMTTVMFTMDGDPLGCPVKPDQLAPLSQSLKALLDERYAADKVKYDKLAKKQRAGFFPADCKKECSCGAYNSFADYLVQEGSKFSAAEKKATDKIAKDLEESSKNPHACLEAEQPWVCDSKTFLSHIVQ